MSKTLVLFASIVSICGVLFAGEPDRPVTMENIVVTAGSRDISAIDTKTSGAIAADHPDSVPQILLHTKGSDLRQRGPYGMQADLSLRGSSFEQSVAAIDGIKVNDPQTGHFNLDLPLTIYDISRVDVNGPGGRGFGGALAGSVDFKTLIPSHKYLKIDSFFGEHALFGQGFSLGLPVGDLTSRLSMEHAVSKAARPNTDFEYYTTSIYLNKDLGSSGIDSFFGYQKKDYGADSFYSDRFPEEEEHTRTIFGKVGFNSENYPLKFRTDAYVRRHDDKFILQRNNPTRVNYHTTYLYGLNPAFSASFDNWDLSGGLDLGNEQINSTNLGKHSRAHEAAFFRLDPVFGALQATLGARFENYQKWGFYPVYNIGAAYDLNRRLKITASYARSTRLPSFTELYYSDAANRGDPGLKREIADNFSVGTEYKTGSLNLGIDGFVRRGYDLIDYTRVLPADVWQATNLGRVDFSGLETYARLNFAPSKALVFLKELSFSWSYQSADRKAKGFQSKYALDILQNKAVLDQYWSILGLDMNLALTYNQRYYGKTFIACDIYIGKKIKKGDWVLEPYISVDNLTGAKMTDVAAVLLPGRWLKSGLKFEW